MITPTDRGELEKAIEQPELYRHIFVRVGGYSERFVDLPRDIQREVMKRTLY
jgi:pyruvate-formate lyase